MRLWVTGNYSGSLLFREPHQRQLTLQGRAAYHSTGLSQRQQRGAWSTTRTHPGQPHPLGTRSVRDSSRPRRSVAATTRYGLTYSAIRRRSVSASRTVMGVSTEPLTATPVR
jgi:hypothetical protein